MSNNPYLMTLPQLLSAKKKIGKVAAFHDPTKNSFAGFTAQALNPSEFREQLRRNFSITLDDAELGATIMMFDKDGDGQVDSVEFINEYFRLGKQERAKRNMYHRDREVKIEQDRRRMMAEREERFLSLLKPTVSDTWTAEEEQEAMRKVARVAYTYDREKDNLIQKLSSMGPLTAGEFKALLRRNFDVYLSPAETGALMKLFDLDGNGTIDCSEFVQQFFRLGRMERDIQLRKQAYITNMKSEAEAARKKSVIDKYGQLVKAKMRPGTDDDVTNVTRRLKIASAYYRPDTMAGPITRCFEAKELDPTEFREVLKRQFGIILTPEELSATVQLFDDNGDGYVSSAEFLSTFFDLGSQEKLRVLRAIKKRAEEISLKEKERLRIRVETALKKVETRVVWPVLPKDDGDDACGMSLPSLFSPAASTNGNKNGNRTSRKLSMAEIFNATLPKEFKSQTSFADLFPKASRDTKMFLKELEGQEDSI